ncbi:hypothetical protein Lesp02_80680 [Lentzea sp. NBRC 105346]|uniref:NmrA family NAD(P)-binding protein n=1 Tax=Lentzea sp. NBRC 105346 TaxID=3032205 RepID=UPI0024A42847|nr:NmrA family NAD(P)-binding protein [Lentzea sp. NBRC 105346]GLZ35881.1 hypothetical protein Lesp02_80680 [Lentzea sp. NBRC 105346]
MLLVKITVTGATGAQGGAVARVAAQHGHEVSRMTRNPKGPQDVYGDFDRPETLGPAFAQADAVFLVTTPFGANCEIETQRGIAAVDAAKHAHVVFTSATNADRGTGIPHFDSKQKIERHLQQTHPQWTVLGPAAFMDDKPSLRLPIPPDLKLHLIAVDDIAAMAVLAMENPERFHNKRIDIAGDLLTGPEMAEILGTEFQEASLEEAERYSHDLAAMFRYFTEVGLEVDIEALKTDYPEIAWHTYADWVSRSRTPAGRTPR